MKKSVKMFVGFVSLVFLLSLISLSVFAQEAKIGVITGDNVNVRSEPDTASKVITKLEKGAKVEVIKSLSDWYKISYDGMTGWVNDDFLVIKKLVTKSGKIAADNVNLRSEPSTDGTVKDKLSKGSSVTVIKVSGDWYNVSTQDGQVGYIHKDFITVSGSSSSRGVVEEVVKKSTKEVKKVQSTVKKKVKKAATNVKEGIEKKLIALSKKYIGVRYRYGGSSPKGFDCSGFTKYVFGKFKINLERCAADQAKQGKKVSKSSLEPGDLVFFDTNGGHNRVNHAGIYIGGGRFIHASSGKARSVTISNINEGFYKSTYMSARRVL